MQKKINLIPMAGSGRRFLDAGYRTPKPLLPIPPSNEPMAVRAARCLPPAEQWIFVCRAHHIQDHQIDRMLRSRFPDASIIRVDHQTEGQACTAMLAVPLMDDEDFLTIGACDNGMRYDSKAWTALCRDPGIDAVIWTFRNNPAVLQNPAMYGWVQVERGGNRVIRVSVKIPLSGSPMNDHAVIGCFSFRRVAVFRHAVESMMKAGRRIRNEFYIDEAMNMAIELGYRVSVFEVDSYVCWGTPGDFETYVRGVHETA
jgi:dTDP-glucose pyrophosphorylase